MSFIFDTSKVLEFESGREWFVVCLSSKSWTKCDQICRNSYIKFSLQYCHHWPKWNIKFPQIRYEKEADEFNQDVL